MAARLVQIFLPERHVAQIEELLPRHSRQFWRETVPGGQEKYSCIVQQRYTERLLEHLETEFGGVKGFLLTVQQLEATIPAIEETPATELALETKLTPPTAIERFFSRDRFRLLFAREKRGSPSGRYREDAARTM